jgi:Tfp pilus assembly protein PilO
MSFGEHMAISFHFPHHGFTRLGEKLSKDPRFTARLVLALLVVANLMAAAAVFQPWGGSPDQLQQRMMKLQSAVRQREQAVARLRKLAETVEHANSEVGRFITAYFLDRRSAYPSILAELNSLAQQSGIKPRGDSFSEEPIEGSDTLGLMIITGNYEGTYANLIHFVNAIDRSPRFITIESLQAAPQQAQGTLNIVLRLNVYLRGGSDRQ